ncbi:MAG: 2-amino-4-hydroxy-6-hydroxymethyldihydropteridine diphosphokinase [Deltaproteobacteria bacterium RBG_16_47_11]|nr:MAG: 2-amino-4-hydroxy-6-hydroxymethyldihydropteridine diphosphokinase [Deltaproteobacteria bacterium RBG_16_47_11]
MRHIAYIGMGSNVGNKLLRCQEAIFEILKIDRNKLLSQSSFYKTQPLGYTDQDWFVNGVIKVETNLEAHELLGSVQALELNLGRRETFRWGPRVIDLDLLFFDEEQIQAGDLVIPHPLLHERQFVLIPLAEIDPYLMHPVFKKTIQELLNNLYEDQGVEKFLP